MSLLRNDPCVFHWQGRWRRDAKVLRVYPEHNGVIRVEDRQGLDYVLLPNEVRSVAEHEKILAEEKGRVAAAEYADLINAWKAGKKTNAELAQATNTPIKGIASRVRAAKRKGLLV